RQRAGRGREGGQPGGRGRQRPGAEPLHVARLHPGDDRGLLRVAMNRVHELRRRLALEGPPWTRPNERDFETVTLPAKDCDRLRDLLIAERVETVVEVGLAYGSSALAIAEALVDVPNPRHVIIDPFQASEY